MDLITIIFTAVGLAMDAFSVSIVSGAVYKKLHLRHAFRISCFFGGFQAIMPLVGSMAGLTVKDYIKDFDHWIAFILLLAIGVKMIYEAFKMKTEEEKNMNPTSLIVLLILAFATSIDALAVGFTLSFIENEILKIILIIGIITFIFSFLGVYIGKRYGHFFENKFEAFGGILLIMIGLKILISHTY